MLKIKGILILVSVAVLIMALLLVACTSPKLAQQFTLRIGFLSVQDSLPYFIMQEQGIDKKNGLLFVEKQYPGRCAVTILEPFLTQALLRKDGKLLDRVIGGHPFERIQNTML